MRQIPDIEVEQQITSIITLAKLNNWKINCSSLASPKNKMNDVEKLSFYYDGYSSNQKTFRIGVQIIENSSYIFYINSCDKGKKGPIFDLTFNVKEDFINSLHQLAKVI